MTRPPPAPPSTSTTPATPVGLRHVPAVRLIALLTRLASSRPCRQRPGGVHGPRHRSDWRAGSGGWTCACPNGQCQPGVPGPVERRPPEPRKRPQSPQLNTDEVCLALLIDAEMGKTEHSLLRCCKYLVDDLFVFVDIAFCKVDQSPKCRLRLDFFAFSLALRTIT